MTRPDAPAGLNAQAQAALPLLRSRRSGSAKAMTGPGPSPAELNAILTIAMRTPDHGKLAPWRFLVVEGAAQERLGDGLAELFRQNNPQAIEELVALERNRLKRAPVVVGVVSCAAPNPKIPEWEQVLSAGAVCMNLCLAAHAHGFAASWVTEWPAYDPAARALFGLTESERIAGFIYIGRPALALEDRPRPALSAKTTRL